MGTLRIARKQPAKRSYPKTRDAPASAAVAAVSREQSLPCSARHPRAGCLPPRPRARHIPTPHTPATRACTASLSPPPTVTRTQRAPRPRHGRDNGRRQLQRRATTTTLDPRASCNQYRESRRALPAVGQADRETRHSRQR